MPRRKLVSPLELRQRSTKTRLLSSRQFNWNGILVEKCQYSPSPDEATCPPLSQHRLIFPLGHPAPLIQKSDDGPPRKSTLQEGDSILVPAGYSCSWRCPDQNMNRPPKQQLQIYLKEELIKQIAEESEIYSDRVDLSNSFGEKDSKLHHIAMLLLGELQSGGIMGRSYVDFVTQALVNHLLEDYSPSTPQLIIVKNRSLTRTQLQQVKDYIHANLDDRNLSLDKMAKVINLSLNYFCSLFKNTTGMSPYQYLIQKRLEQAQFLLSKTDLEIAQIALEVGFCNQSHLTQHFKRFTGVTPRQFRKS